MSIQLSKAQANLKSTLIVVGFDMDMTLQHQTYPHMHSDRNYTVPLAVKQIQSERTILGHLRQLFSKYILANRHRQSY